MAIADHQSQAQKMQINRIDKYHKPKIVSFKENRIDYRIHPVLALDLMRHLMENSHRPKEAWVTYKFLKRMIICWTIKATQASKKINLSFSLTHSQTQQKTGNEYQRDHQIA